MRLRHQLLIKAANIGSLESLVSNKVCTKRMAESIARSGLDLQCLKITYESMGQEGLRTTFLTRVPNCKKFLDRNLPKLVSYFDECA